jgi:hypothetical protein
MKKQIQEDLSRLAAELSRPGRSSGTVELKQLCARIYEKLCILEYLEKQVEGETGKQDTASFDSKSFREQNWFVEPEPVPQPEHQEDLVEPLMEKIKDIVAQMPRESQQIDALIERVLPSDEPGRKQLEEIASEYQQMPVFERKKPQEEKQDAKRINDTQMSRPKSINDQVIDGIKIGLNDRLAFVNKLFDGSSEDYNRVMSQIATMNSMAEVQDFIERQVKPDYNWEQQELEARFYGLIERGFN